MKENLCEKAAVRIHYWFGKENLIRAWHSSSQQWLKRYKCDHVKSARIPSQVDHLPLQGYVFSRKKRQAKSHRKITQENFSKHCTISQKNINHLQPEKALSSARVGYTRLKEHFLVSKRLKTIGKPKTANGKRRHVVTITATKEPRNPFLEEWTKIQEERHFQLDRVIKYLAE